MNSDKAAAVRDSINGCPTVIGEEAVVDREGREPIRPYTSPARPDHVVVGDYTDPTRYTYRPAYIKQSGELGNGNGARRPVFVVVLEPLWTEYSDVRSLPPEVVYEVAKHGCWIRFYPADHRLGEPHGAIWIVDHLSQDLSESDGDRCPECNGTYFKLRDGEPECASCGYVEQLTEQTKLVAGGAHE